MKAVCYCAVSHALWHDSTHASMWLRIAAAVRFAFHALHRPAELYNLVRRNLKLPAGSLLGGAHVAVAIAIDPKNRAFMGRLQVRMVRDDSAIAWLNWVTQGMLPGSHIWPMSYRCFRDCLSHCLGYLQLGHLSITPASLRAGGATWMLGNGTLLSVIRFAGSWASERAMSCSLQEAESASVLLSITPLEQSRLEALLNDFAVFEKPPKLPFLAFCYGSSGSM